ncbi:unnamed protein product, partial [Bubo scandiacus]
MNFVVFPVTESLLIFPVESPLEARKLHKTLAMMISYAITLLRPKALVIVQCEGKNTIRRDFTKEVENNVFKESLMANII